LIDNAIKFSPDGGKVEIIYEGTRLVENKWKKIISIEDEGPGIPNEIKSKYLNHSREMMKRFIRK